METRHAVFLENNEAGSSQAKEIDLEEIRANVPIPEIREINIPFIQTEPHNVVPTTMGNSGPSGSTPNLKKVLMVIMMKLMSLNRIPQHKMKNLHKKMLNRMWIMMKINN